MYFPIGFPLEFVPEEGKDKLFELETKIEVANKFVMLDHIIINVWLGLDPSKKDDVVTQEFDELSHFSYVRRQLGNEGDIVP